MKTIITSLALATLTTPEPPQAEARTCHSPPIYISGYRSCGAPIHAERYLIGYDQCSRPIWGTRLVCQPLQDDLPPQLRCSRSTLLSPTKIPREQHRRPMSIPTLIINGKSKY